MKPVSIFLVYVLVVVLSFCLVIPWFQANPEPTSENWILFALLVIVLIQSLSLIPVYALLKWFERCEYYTIYRETTYVFGREYEPELYVQIWKPVMHHEDLENEPRIVYFDKTPYIRMLWALYWFGMVFVFLMPGLNLLSKVATLIVSIIGVYALILAPGFVIARVRAQIKKGAEKDEKRFLAAENEFRRRVQSRIKEVLEMV